MAYYSSMDSDSYESRDEVWRGDSYYENTYRETNCRRDICRDDPYRSNVLRHNPYRRDICYEENCQRDVYRANTYREDAPRGDTYSYHLRSRYRPQFVRYRLRPSYIYVEAEVPSRYITVEVRFWNLCTQTEHRERLSIRCDKDRQGNYKKDIMLQLTEAAERLPSLGRRVRFSRDMEVSSAMMNCDTVRRHQRHETELTTKDKTEATRLLIRAHDKGTLDYIDAIYRDGPL
ncbi:hypothetical protein Micbo1qcDRAFT_206250 [Microdochium bolleyi]|uniref:Uncharacterized protein n=1 Tax=Microdochium bolleyi TaxID=196109 RepID=A0A136IX13_9PEZI|nr:hypothetical protein Micbo1qcDRAFT_206250 [Microdochium bolleyi]